MPTADSDDRVLQLLAIWEEHRGQGRDVPPEELCAECPELVDDVRHRIGQLRELEDPLSLGTRSDRIAVAEDSLTRDSAPGESQAAPRPRYRRLRLHACGGLGEVHVAHDTEVGREVALKEMQDGPARDPNGRARFLREAAITGALEHPGIVPVHGLGTYPDGRPFYAMRLIKGDTLAAAIDRFHDREKPRAERSVELRRLLARFLAVCEVVGFAHSRGVIHRDIKPSNIIHAVRPISIHAVRPISKFIRQQKHDPRPSPPSSAPGERAGSFTQPVA